IIRNTIFIVRYSCFHYKILFDIKNNQLKISTAYIITGFIYSIKITPLRFPCQPCGFSFL
ncbi:TPA: hypothetical protein HML89_27125, partial [Escherichia coli]|nr:hypothetical protein [Escherichia coli]